MGDLRVVGIGGGTGLPALLAGLSNRRGVSVSAVVSVADNGGSSGRLREGFGMPAVGDLRNCLVALSERDTVLADLFQHRFVTGGSLEGHALGNLVVVALYERTGSMERALELVSRLLRVQGRALAATEAAVTVCAALRDGRVIRGESQISEAGGLIDRLWLEPENPPASPGVLEAIRSADVIAFAPGSLYTSLVPNLLVSGVVDAIRESDATRIMVCNIATQPGETDGFSAADHLRVVREYLGGCQVHHCIVNSALPRSVHDFADPGARLVRYDPRSIRELGAAPIFERLLASGEHGKIRHDSEKLGSLIVQIATSWDRSDACDERLRAFLGEPALSLMSESAMSLAQPAIA